MTRRRIVRTLQLLLVQFNCCFVVRIWTQLWRLPGFLRKLHPLRLLAWSLLWRLAALLSHDFFHTCSFQLLFAQIEKVESQCFEWGSVLGVVQYLLLVQDYLFYFVVALSLWVGSWPRTSRRAWRSSVSSLCALDGLLPSVGASRSRLASWFGAFSMSSSAFAPVSGHLQILCDPRLQLLQIQLYLQLLILAIHLRLLHLVNLPLHLLLQGLVQIVLLLLLILRLIWPHRCSLLWPIGLHLLVLSTLPLGYYSLSLLKYLQPKSISSALFGCLQPWILVSLFFIYLIAFCQGHWNSAQVRLVVSSIVLSDDFVFIFKLKLPVGNQIAVLLFLLLPQLIETCLFPQVVSDQIVNLLLFPFWRWRSSSGLNAPRSEVVIMVVECARRSQRLALWRWVVALASRKEWDRLACAEWHVDGLRTSIC